MMEETTAATVVSLPEDVVREILVRVGDAVALFRCSAACRQWRHLIADASFLDRLASSSLTGFFTAKRLAHASTTSLVSTPWSEFGPGHRFLHTFFPGAEGSLLNHAVPVAARGGLLLVRLATRGVRVVRLAVCNLFAGAWDVLVPLECNWNFDESGYAIIITGEDYSSGGEEEPLPSPGYSAFFKVIIIAYGNLHTFSSAESRWNASRPIIYLPVLISIHWPLRHPIAVVSHGTAHWLAWCSSFDVDGLYTIDVDLKTCHVSLTKIAIPREYIIPRKTHDRPQLSVTAGGTLLLLHLQRPGLRLDIWTQQDDGGSEDGGRWLCTPDVELKLPEQHADINTNLVYLSFLGENSGSGTLFLKDNCGYVYNVDLENKAIEELMEMDMDYERINCQEVVPFEMDWKRFLISRLHSRQQT